MLAHHFSRAEVWDKALDYLLEAAPRRRPRPSPCARRSPSTRERSGRRDRLGGAGAGGHAHGDPSERAPTCSTRSASSPSSRREAEALLDLARRAGDRAARPAPWCRARRRRSGWRTFPGRSSGPPRPSRWARPSGPSRRSRAARLDHRDGARASRPGSIRRRPTLDPRPRHQPGGGHRQAARARAAAGLGFLRNWQGRYQESLELSQRGRPARPRARAVVSPLLRCLWTEGVASTSMGDYDAALRGSRRRARARGEDGQRARADPISSTRWDGFASIADDLERGIALQRAEASSSPAAAATRTGFERGRLHPHQPGDAFMEQGRSRPGVGGPRRGVSHRRASARRRAG